MKLRLESLLLEGLTSSKGLPLTADFWPELKADAHQILRSKPDLKDWRIQNAKRTLIYQWQSVKSVPSVVGFCQLLFANC